MRTIKFSQNWNDKLLLNKFSTIRPFSNTSPAIGEIVEVEFKEKKHKCEVLHLTVSPLNNIPEYLFYLDTGYSKTDSIKMFENMFKNKDFDIYKVNWCIMVIKQRPDLDNI